MATGTGPASIGPSVKLRGELSGTEDLEFNGEIKGSISLTDAQLTIGANGKVNGDVSAKNVVILGKVEGNVKAVERVDLRASSHVSGEVTAARLQVEPGAELHVKVKQTAADTPGTAGTKAQAADKPVEAQPETPNLFTAKQGASEADAGTAKPAVDQSKAGSKK